MVGNYRFNAKAFRVCDFFHRSYAVVYRYNKVNALLLKFVHSACIHTIAFAFTVRYVINHVPAARLYVGVKHGGSRNAVGIVVAVDRYFFKAVQSGVYPAGGSLHAGY